MIYTLTLNPAIDLFIETKHLEKNIVNRTNSYDVQANGKGVNVSLVLKMLEVNNCALGIGGGFTLDYIVDFLKEKGIETDFLRTPGITRINVFTRVLEPNEEYKIVNPGPAVDQETLNQLMDKLKEIKSGDYLVISGSFAKGIDPAILTQIAKLSQTQGFNLIVDTSYQEVTQILDFHPFLLKPDKEELMSWFNLTEEPDIGGYDDLCQQLIDRGAQRILLSLGSKGALYVDKDHSIYGNAPKGVVVNTACSGDTMLGTFIEGLISDKSLGTNLSYSIAAGSSTAFQAGLTDFTDVMDLEKQITIKHRRG
ncbi:1-phosphofructokinase [Xylocopilactobacillus apis]|uniref:Tagatose-6-phosphate kinase n=1 Tax=Xylocopilactobacillus apis TaxID=2932183 RepID=A0AAU9DQS4_9LACO|nr:1-phosphofructokinase [Xylocopilactobacillus apis]BDR55953.1 tagatose-6-phosphate kinase [Xylocopilactobacillus apis]